MIRILHGNIISAPKFGELSCVQSGYLVAEDGVITGVFETLPERFRSETIDEYPDALVLQGFCDMHLHAPQYPMVGMGMDLKLLQWLNQYAFPVETAFADPDYARKIYRQLADELVRNGTTRVCMFSSIHTEATWILMEELEAAGISGYVGKVNMDRNQPDYYIETTEESKHETLRWLKGCERFTQIKPILTPRFTPSCSDELMEWLGKIACERNLPVQSHLSENHGEIAWVKSLHPDTERYWETYAKYGLFKKGTLMAHCIYSDEVEREAMRRYGVTVVHCASSNFNITSGVAPVRKLLTEGNAVTLGSDIAGGSQISMLQVMQTSILASKVMTMQTRGEDAFLSAAEAYYLATSAGAAYFGDQPGFAAGNPLYAVVIDDTRLPCTEKLTLAERLERAIYRTDHTDIKAVYNGEKRAK